MMPERKMRRDRERQTLERVSTFEHGDDASARMPARDADHDVGELGEILIGQREPAERIAGARVEAGGNHHQLRLEPVRGGHEDLRNTPRISLRPDRRERVVDDEAAAFAVALLVRTAGARIPRVLVNVENSTAPSLQNTSCVRCVMHVPVGDENPIDAVPPPRVSRADRDVVEHAEPHAAALRGVMAGGRTAQKRGSRRPFITASTAETTVPAAASAAVSDPGESSVSPVLSVRRRQRSPRERFSDIRRCGPGGRRLRSPAAASRPTGGLALEHADGSMTASSRFGLSG